MLLSITGGPDLSLIEASEAAEVVRQAAHPEAEIIFGASVDEDMSEEVWITVIATRFDENVRESREAIAAVRIGREVDVAHARGRLLHDAASPRPGEPSE